MSETYNAMIARHAAERREAQRQADLAMRATHAAEIAAWRAARDTTAAHPATPPRAASSWRLSVWDRCSDLRREERGYTFHDVAPYLAHAPEAEIRALYEEQGIPRAD